METFEDRLRRFLFGAVREIPLTLLSSIANFFLPQIQEAGKQRLEYPVLLSTHAIIQIVAEQIFGQHGPPGTEFYLRQFVDTATPNRTYSAIYTDIHAFRNVIAHRWMSGGGHLLAIDYTISGGFEKRGPHLHFNPAIFLEDFSAGFDPGGRIWGYQKLTTDDDLLIRKYEFIADWLKLPKKDPIRPQIDALRAQTPGPGRSAIENAIQADIATRYSL